MSCLLDKFPYAISFSNLELTSTENAANSSIRGSQLHMNSFIMVYIFVSSAGTEFFKALESLRIMLRCGFCSFCTLLQKP